MESADPHREEAPVSSPEPAAPHLPAVLQQAAVRASSRRRWRAAAGLALLLVVAVFGASYWWQHRVPALPPGIASGNGRLEADEIDIATKFAGRIAKLFVDEGDLVTAGQAVAMMDTRDLEASLKRSQALAAQAQRVLDEAKANLAQQQAVETYAQQELARTAALVRRGAATVEQLDQHTQQRDAAVAAVAAATHRVGAAQHARDAAQHEVELYRVNISDSALRAPKSGPIEYRIANVGEVLPAGGKVFTMLDASYLYMDIYLPTRAAGRVRIGAAARIVLDAYPKHVIPARVVFVASQAQFTPKTVETREERDKLMFRVRTRIDPDRLKGRERLVKTGLPGVAYVRLDPAALWPVSLRPSPPLAP